MSSLLNSPKAVGLHVIANRNGQKVKGKIDRFVSDGMVVVEFDPEFVGEWEDNFDYFHPRDLKLDYDPEAMKELMKHWRQTTGTTAGPGGPMKHVKSFLTGKARRRTRKQSKKSRKTQKSKKRI